VKKANIGKELSSTHFSITDSGYGITGNLHLCASCGFLQCFGIANVLSYYEALEDRAYEDSRPARSLQAKMILDAIHQYCPSGRLLDIGAGSGILVEQAANKGYEAEGVEPSRWLQRKAQERGLAVYPGAFPNEHIKGRYDVMTVIDVIEHVSDPLQLLSDANKYLNENGVLIIITPDVHSLAAKMLGWKWWHFRVAHIGYFNKNTLRLVTEKTGFRIVTYMRPSWCFTVDYLWERLKKYLPGTVHFSMPSSLREIKIRLNLRDSLMVVCKLNSQPRI
jgi:SAM-dependent methyltransferase